MGFEALAEENKEVLLEVFRKRHEKKEVEDLDIGGMKHMVSKLLVDKFTPPDEVGDSRCRVSSIFYIVVS